MISGDIRTTLGTILHRDSGNWFRYIFTILKNREDVEDVIQEAIRRVLAHNRPIPSTEEAKMYLGRAIGNTAFELYKTRKRERIKYVPIADHIFSQALTWRPDVLFEEQEQTTEKNGLIHLLQRGLERLPVKQYEAIRLTFLDASGSSIRDIVAASGIPYSTLRQRKKQGIRTLRRFFERELHRRARRE